MQGEVSRRWPLAWLTSGLVLASIALGGGTRPVFFSEIVLQAGGVLLLAACVWYWLQAKRSWFGDGLVAVSVVIAVAPFALQLMPVSVLQGAGVSSLVPGGDAAALSSAFPRQGTISISPDATWAAAVSLVVPAAVFFGVALMSVHRRILLARILVGCAVVSAFLGMTQMALGPETALRFFAVTNPDDAVGFFANRNHFAALLFVALVLAAPWITVAIQRALRDGGEKANSIIAISAAFMLVLVLLTGITLSRSRAGLILGAVALAGVALLFLSAHLHGDARQKGGATGLIAGGVVAALALVAGLSLTFGSSQIATRLDQDLEADLRVPLFATTYEAAMSSLPFGTGFGTFVPVYGIAEKRDDLFFGYANRAHNDFVELFLEAGYLGVALVAAFLLWFTWRGLAVWLRKPQTGELEHVLLQRAATIAVLLLLAHSFVDYPLRTTAMAVVFAVACGVLVAPMAAPGGASSSGPVRVRSVRPRAPGTPPPASAEAKRTETQPGKKLWASDQEWPDAWRRGPGARHDGEN